MNHTVRPVVCAALFLAAAGLAQAQSSECKSVRFGEAVLSRFPNVADACLDVITREGQQYAVIKMQLDEVRGNTVRVRVRQPDGGYGKPMNITTQPERRVLIEGKPVRVSELAPNQELTAYVRVDRPMLALAPPTETEPLEAVPIPASEPALASAEPTMPHTAGNLGLLALLGQFLLVVALTLSTLRKRT
jgi:hypothetical protein